jgi:hypothetical protein
MPHGRDNPYVRQATPCCGQPRSGRYSLLPTRPSRNTPSLRSRREICIGEGVTSVPERAFAGRNSSTNCPISHSPRPQELVRGAVGCGAAPVEDRRLDPAALHPDGHLDRLEVAGLIQDALVAASLTSRIRSSTTSPEMAADSCCTLVRTVRPSPTRPGRRGGKEPSSYCPLPALLPSWPGGGSCRPG